MFGLFDKPWTRGLLAIAIIVLAFVAWGLIKNSAPKPTRKPPEQVVRLVDVEVLEQSLQRPFWITGGSVMASQQVDLVAQVSGILEWLADNANPGEQLKAGTLLARIEPLDYELIVKQREAELAQAQASLLIEHGQVELALEEYQLSGQELAEQDQVLILREPQLKSAQAVVKAAEAALLQAQKNLERTEIRMPFDGQLVWRNINLGGQANASSAIFSVVATNEFWLEIKIPRAFLSTLDTKTPAEIQSGQSVRPAKILNVLPDVDSTDRQVKVLLSIPEPMNPKLGEISLINDFVEVKIFGQAIENAYAIPRSKLIDNQYIWVVNQTKLFKRKVEVAYAGREFVWVVSGFEPEDQLLVSQIDAPIEGMSVRLSSSTPKELSPDGMMPKKPGEAQSGGQP